MKAYRAASAGRCVCGGVDHGEPVPEEERCGEEVEGEEHGFAGVMCDCERWCERGYGGEGANGPVDVWAGIAVDGFEEAAAG